MFPMIRFLRRSRILHQSSKSPRTNRWIWKICGRRRRRRSRKWQIRKRLQMLGNRHLMFLKTCNIFSNPKRRRSKPEEKEPQIPKMPDSMINWSTRCRSTLRNLVSLKIKPAKTKMIYLRNPLKIQSLTDMLSLTKIFWIYLIQYNLHLNVDRAHNLTCGVIHIMFSFLHSISISNLSLISLNYTYRFWGWGFWGLDTMILWFLIYQEEW